MKYAQVKKTTTIEAAPAAEQEWHGLVFGINSQTLFSGADSWYNGSNIPDKPVEPLSFLGGLPLYMQKCNEAADKDYEGFVLTT